MQSYKPCNYHELLMDTLLISDLRPAAGSFIAQRALTRKALAVQAAQIRIMLEAIRAMQQSANEPSWAMLMGDFNSIPGSAIYRYQLRCTFPSLHASFLRRELYCL